MATTTRRSAIGTILRSSGSAASTPHRHIAENEPNPAFRTYGRHYAFTDEGTDAGTINGKKGNELREEIKGLARELVESRTTYILNDPQAAESFGNRVANLVNSVSATGVVALVRRTGRPGTPFISSEKYSAAVYYFRELDRDPGLLTDEKFVRRFVKDMNEFLATQASPLRFSDAPDFMRFYH